MNLFDKSVLFLYKGNSIAIDIQIVDSESGEPISVTSTDYILFTVVNARDEIVIQKRLTESDYDPETKIVTCLITPEDTMSLPTGEYNYDCLFVYDGTTPTTFVSSCLVIRKSYGKIGQNGGDTDGQ